MSKSLSCWIFLILISSTFAFNVNDESVLQQWKNMEKGLTNGMENLIKMALPKMMEASGKAEQINLSEKCTSAMFKIFNDFRRLKFWTIEMLDAFGKPGDGQSGMSGDFESCRSLRVHKKDGSEAFRGKYCRIVSKAPLGHKPDGPVSNFEAMTPFDNITFKTEFFHEVSLRAGFMHENIAFLGLCLPSVCSEKDLKAVIESIRNQTSFLLGTYKCSIDGDSLLNFEALIVIPILLFFILLVVVATTVDMVFSSRRISSTITVLAEELDRKDSRKLKYNKPYKMLMCFSLQQNLKRLMSVEQPSDKRFSVFNGLRFFTMCWIILAHSILSMGPQFIRNMDSIGKIMGSFWMQGFVNGFNSVDTFFFMSSVLMSYSLIQMVDKKGIRVFNIPIIIIRRILRLLPGPMLILGITFLQPLFASGSFWEIAVQNQIEMCRDGWWRIPLFVLNYTPTDEICQFQLWYVSAEMHLFLMSLVYLFIYFKNPKVGNICAVAVIIVAVLANGIVIYRDQYPISVFLTYPHLKFTLDYVRNIIFNTHVHVSVYFVGLLTGTYLAKKPITKISSRNKVIGWIVATMLALGPFFLPYYYYHHSYPPAAVSILYHSLNRTIWSLFLAWVTILCANDRGGVIQQLLSWKGFTPLNKPSYMMYMCHLMVMFLYGHTLQGSIDMNQISVIIFFLGFTLIAYAVATILMLIFESPLIRLEKIIFNTLLNPRGRRTKAPTKLKVEDPVVKEKEEIVTEDTVTSQEPEENKKEISTQF